MCAMGVAIGLATGLGAVGVGSLVGFFHNLFFYGEISTFYNDEELIDISPFGPLIILAPIIGGLGVVFITRTFGPEARGNGVPEVMDAIYHRGGRMRPRIALVKAIASSLSIGSGASVGREGPMVQIGAAVGSAFGQFANLASWQRVTLLAAGAGAGIAATFNTPLGAVMFAIELMLPEVSTRTFLPVVLATGAATYVGRLFFGLQPVFVVQLPDVPTAGAFAPLDFLGFALLGVIGGLVAFMFIRALFDIDDLFQRLFPNPYLACVVAMSIVGATFYGLQLAFGHYYVAGVGYDVVQVVLRGELSELHVLAVVFVAKMLVTGVSLGGGASGGGFSPSLVVGAALGGAYGALLDLIWPVHSFTVAEYAMIGMAVVSGGATGAAMTAITMVFELTRDYNIIVPLIVAVPIAIGVRRIMLVENLYTLRLARRGRPVPTNRHTNMYLVRSAREVMDVQFAVAEGSTSLGQVSQWLSESAAPNFIILAHQTRIEGVVSFDDRIRTPHLLSDPEVLGDLAIKEYVYVRENSIMSDVIRRMARQNARIALVVQDKPGIPRAGDVVGVIGKPQIADAMMRDQAGV